MKLLRFIDEAEFNTLVNNLEVSALKRETQNPWTTNVLYFFRTDFYELEDFIPLVNELSAYYGQKYTYAITLEDDWANRRYGKYPVEFFDKLLKFEIQKDNGINYYVVPESHISRYLLKHITQIYKFDGTNLIKL